MSINLSCFHSNNCSKTNQQGPLCIWCILHSIYYMVHLAMVYSTWYAAIAQCIIHVTPSVSFAFIVFNLLTSWVGVGLGRGVHLYIGLYTILETCKIASFILHDFQQTIFWKKVFCILMHIDLRAAGTQIYILCKAFCH